MKKRLREPVSGLTHLAEVLPAVAGLVVLLSTAAGVGRTHQILAFEIFGCSLNRARAVRLVRSTISYPSLRPPWPGFDGWIT